MNTIEEVIEKKNDSLYETYVKEICSDCANRKNTDDLCNIVVTIEKKAKCVNFERCMKNQCNTCIEQENCFKD